jgi:hypothetical protein
MLVEIYIRSIVIKKKEEEEEENRLTLSTLHKKIIKICKLCSKKIKIINIGQSLLFRLHSNLIFHLFARISIYIYV